MTLIEVIIALSILALTAVPLSVGFMNSLILRQITDEQIDANTVTWTIKEQISNNIQGKDHSIKDSSDTPYYIYDYLIDDPDLEESPKLTVHNSEFNIGDFYFIVKYDHSEGSKYPNSFYVDVEIYKESEEGVQSSFSIAVYRRED
jgi:type II secretory pathway pseudopilin PulG